MSDLLRETDCRNVEEVVQLFTEYEEENYILFRNVNQLDDEFESLQRQKMQLSGELEKIKLAPKDSVKDAKASKIKELMKEIKETDEKKESLKLKLDSQNQIWAKVKR